MPCRLKLDADSGDGNILLRSWVAASAPNVVCASARRNLKVLYKRDVTASRAEVARIQTQVVVLIGRSCFLLFQ